MICHMRVIWHFTKMSRDNVVKSEVGASCDSTEPDGGEAENELVRVV